MKPIEPGCLAILVGLVRQPEANGMVVKVIKFSEWHSERVGERAWLVGSDNPARVGARERHLMRIDGGEDESVTTEQGQEVTA